ncbi:hypothetical protein PBY51_008953 [Eleginops maclovinus]|uniref:Uncharacterized protein n=1 Tax=Eleginops maclovinus TaxID=56733 RepID=A0AAN7WU07_ELEMC|nr:hypothetical protein PBY51_008953 [Eleginops maclovinus]
MPPRASSKEALEASGSTAPASSSVRLLCCHCFRNYPRDSVNNTCRADGFCYAMVEDEGRVQVVFGCPDQTFCVRIWVTHL